MKNSSIGINLIGLLGVALVLLRVVGVIHWPLPWVFFPIIVVGVLLLTGMAIVAAGSAAVARAAAVLP